MQFDHSIPVEKMRSGLCFLFCAKEGPGSVRIDPLNEA
jgi:hypothetical protein